MENFVEPIYLNSGERKELADKLKIQMSKVSVYLGKCRYKNADQLLAITDMDGIPKDILLSNLQTATAYKPHLNNYATYVNCLSAELASRGYNVKSLLVPLLAER
jgi:hypothetical protein